jgi:hypothetical protein
LYVAGVEVEDKYDRNKLKYNGNKLRYSRNIMAVQLKWVRLNVHQKWK